MTAVFLAVFCFSWLFAPGASARPAQGGARVPNDPEYDNTQKNMWENMGAPEAWNYGTGSPRVVVAILDTGADTWHPDLRDNVWKNLYETPDNGIDDDNNGYVDDINGWNFIENNNDARTVVATDDEKDPTAVHHGTLVAGLLGAVGNNGRDGTGLNWRVSIMPLRAMNSKGAGSVIKVAEAVIYAVNNGADVIGMSFVGDEKNEDLKMALRRAYEAGIVIVAAGGNEGRTDKGDLDLHPRYPVCYDAVGGENWILGVGSLDESNRPSVFSDYGGCIDISVLGQSIYSTERYAPVYGYLDEFGGPWAGTSFSVPLVAGAAALIKSIRPDWGAREIIDNLLENSDTIDGMSYVNDGRMGKGRLNIGRAAKAASAAPMAFPPPHKFYYAIGDEIGAYDSWRKDYLFWGKNSGGKIVDYAAGQLNDDKFEEMAVLFYGQSKHLLRVMREDGEIWQEFPLNEGKGFLAKAVRIFGDDGGYYAVVEWQNNKKGETKLVQYKINVDGLERQRQYIFKGMFLKWTIGAGGHLFLAKITQKKLILEERDFVGKLFYSWQKKNVAAVKEMSAGNVFGGDRSQVVLLAERVGVKNKKGPMAQIMVDLPSGSSMERNLTSEEIGKKILVADFNYDNKAEILFYNFLGGIFPIYNAAGDSVGGAELPDFTAEKPGVE